jgi:ABC-2 type transport system permease protein
MIANNGVGTAPRAVANTPLSTTLAYTKFELLRTFRNRRFFVFSLGFPLVMYFLIAGPNKNNHHLGASGDFPGVFAPLYYMVSLIAFGTMTAVMAGGARIAAERSVGWNRQLRLTPLSTRTYFRTKVITSYLMALTSILLMYLAGTLLGVRLPASQWLEMTALVLVALVPFAAIGILMGHLLTVDSMGPALGGLSALFAFLGGTWFPITGGGALVEIAKSLPSYWLVQAGQVGVGGGAFPPRGWIVLAIWTAVFAILAGRAYQRDTKRV